MKLIGNVCFAFFVFFLRAAPEAYGGPRLRVKSELCQSHSNARSKPSLQPISQLTATLGPQPTEQSQGSNLRPHGYQSDSFPLSHDGNSSKSFFFSLDKVDLQYCVSFKCTAKELIIYVYLKLNIMHMFFFRLFSVIVYYKIFNIFCMLTVSPCCLSILIEW